MGVVLRSETSISRDPGHLCPGFYEKAKAGLAHAHLDGYDAEIFEAWRSPQRQDWLFEQGRSKPGHIVTNARAWQSWHQYGLAVDFAFYRGGKWSWDDDFTKLVPYMQAFGLEWLGPKDPGHFQLTRGMRFDQAYSLVKSSGVQRLWMEVLT